MRTVIVGKGGSIGAVLAQRLAAEAIEVRVPDASASDTIADVADADVVINAGGPRVRPGLGTDDYFREHVGLATRLARSMKEGAHLVHLSSTAVYGARGTRLALDAIEAPTLFPSSAYACAKLAAEHAARATGTARGVKVTILRPSMVYGPGVDSALASLKKLAKRGIALHLEPSTVRQHLVHMDLLVDSIARAAQRPPERSRMLVVADPFVLTNADLVPRAGRAIHVPLGPAKTAHRLAKLMAMTPPGAIDALAVLGIDNVFDEAPIFEVLGLDRMQYARESTFDPYWEGDA